VMLMVPACPESGFWDVPPGRGPPVNSIVLELLERGIQVV